MDNVQKFSISVPKHLYDFVSMYQSSENLNSRSEVMVEALKTLQQKYLEECYKEADNDSDKAWENTNMDGLDDEAW